ncbi:MAG: hypothetical protein ABJA74_06410 [Lapillicoccus sp.]
MTPTQETPRKSLSRRTLLGLAAGTALLPVAVSGGSAQATGHRRVFPPDTVALPVGLRPEGITSGPGFTFYVGSLADGRIVIGNLLFGSVHTLLPGATGRQIRGLFWDARTGLVWAAGNVGAEAHVWAVRGSSGTVVSDTVVPDGVFLNDLVVTRRAVYVTDSRKDRLTVIALGPGGMPTGAAPTFVDLSGAWPANTTMTNANGIREMRDGSLVLNNSRVGGLWQVDPETGVTAAIPVEGGPGITSGDGLELAGPLLYNVRGSGPREVSVLRLRRTPSAWTATWVKALTDDSLDVPSTATLAGPWLWAVNARFGVPSPETATYWVTRLPAF